MSFFIFVKYILVDGRLLAGMITESYTISKKVLNSTALRWVFALCLPEMKTVARRVKKRTKISESC